jgi:hypothetical protein
MVQVESSAGYDGFVDERHPEGGSRPEDGLGAAVRGLIESVTATSHQFAEAAESFARETMRVMEGLLSSVDHSAGETRDLASLAGRAADEARRISDESKAEISAAREQVRAEVEAMVAEVRAQIEDAVRSTSESVAGARAAADEAQERNREAAEQMAQSLQASREAASAAEAAAEAARRSAEGIEQAAAQAQERLTGPAVTLDAAATANIEESLRMSREAAAVAQQAAEDARKAASEAMSHAAEARALPQSDSGSAASLLLDRLEEDYARLTDLVRELHNRLSGSGASVATAVMPAEPTAASDASETSDEELTAPAAWEQPAAEVAAAASDPWTGWAGAEPEDETEVEASGDESGTEPIDLRAWREESRTVTLSSEAAAADEEGEAAHPEPQPAAKRDWWTTPQSYTFGTEAPAPVYDSSPEPDLAAREEVALASDVAADPAWAVDEPAAESPAPAPEPFWRWNTAAEEMAPLAEATPAVPMATGVEHFESDGWNGPLAKEEAPEPVTLSGRVILNVSPVPDFDRLLSLDGALGRLACIRNVTLADYAKEEVTFRVEMADATSVEEFANGLAQAGGQRFEVAGVSPGQLDLRVVPAGV